MTNRRGARRIHGPGRANPAFWIVAICALAMLAVVIGVEKPAEWFGFSPPPAAWVVLALLLPWAMLGAASGLFRLSGWRNGPSDVTAR
jgi:hypothetical protein